MELTEVLGFAGALAVGLLLGLMGSGGSIMAVPILSYLFHINPITTTAYSLFVVGTSASVGSLRFLKHGMIDMKVALWFAVPAFTTVYSIRKFLIPGLPEVIPLSGDLMLDRDKAIMTLFALILMVSAASILLYRTKSRGRASESAPHPILLAGMGVFVGLITGLVGVGGGFLIIPGLVLFAGLPMIKGVATSLFIIAVNSMIGFTGNLGMLEIDWTFLLSFTGVSLLGILVGTRLSPRFREDKLRKGFAWLCLGTAVFILYSELTV